MRCLTVINGIVADNEDYQRLIQDMINKHYAPILCGKKPTFWFSIKETKYLRCIETYGG